MDLRSLLELLAASELTTVSYAFPLQQAGTTIAEQVTFDSRARRGLEKNASPFPVLILATMWNFPCRPLQKTLKSMKPVLHALIDDSSRNGRETYLCSLTSGHESQKTRRD